MLVRVCAETVLRCMCECERVRVRACVRARVYVRLGCYHSDERNHCLLSLSPTLMMRLIAIVAPAWRCTSSIKSKCVLIKGSQLTKERRVTA